MYEGSHVPLEIMSDFYGKVSTSSWTYDRAARAKQQNKRYLVCAAELPRPHHEAVHGHFLPAWDDPSVLRERFLHEAQHRLWASAPLQRPEGEAYRTTTPSASKEAFFQVCCDSLATHHRNFSSESNFSRTGHLLSGVCSVWGRKRRNQGCIFSLISAFLLTLDTLLFLIDCCH